MLRFRVGDQRFEVLTDHSQDAVCGEVEPDGKLPDMPIRCHLDGVKGR